MAKEMFISSSPHETKVAVLEDDQLVEVYYERDTDVGLVGGIYKGRVNRVLPGMQSAFVDIGLERDAFLYVSDFFFEDQEEYDKVFEEAEARATKYTAENPVAVAVAEPPKPTESAVAPPASAEPAPPLPPPVAEARPNEVPTPAPGPTAPPEQGTAPPQESREYRRFDPRARRRHRRGRGGFGDRDRDRDREREHRFTPRPEAPANASFEILPGESLAKYSHATPEAETSATPPSEITAEPENASPIEPIVASEAPSAEAQAGEGSEATAAPSLASESVPEVPNEPPSTESAPTASSEVIPPTSFAVAMAATPEANESPATAEPPVIQVQAELEDAAPALEVTPVAPQDLVAEPSAPTESPSLDATTAPSVIEPLPTITEYSPASAEPLVSEAIPNAEPASTEEPSGEPVSEATATPEGVATPQPPAATEEAPAQSTTVPASSPDASSGPGERTYTLREPHQRPRFAPRRRRGRRGMGHQRPEGRREPTSRPGNNQPLQISELLKEGQEILVQIAKEPLGTKGARITSHIALPGRYLVYMPTIVHIGVSRKIASEEERLRLRNIILENKGSLTGGFIVRTAGEGRSAEEFKADLKFLSTLWSDIRAKADRTRAPAMIHRDLDLVQRLLRDTLTPDFKSIRVDNEIDYERVLDFVSRSQPSLVDKVKLYTRNTPLFEEFGVQSEIEKALKPKVWLRSGGYIVINQTEALVAVDVNTGKFVGKTNRLEDTIVKTNIDAVNEIVRQIRLRDLGGIIVIDFIDMDERKNRAKVVQALEEALRHDRAPTKVISFHDFGLVAITRKRVKQSLERTLCEPCNYCTGSGWIKSVHTVCNEILAEAKKMARQIEGDSLTLRVNPEVAKALKSREGVLVTELESLTKKDVIIKSDPNIHQERFEIF
ncbi:MAG: Rne/Rng family ribonuclease [Acidobacteriia bacterium]|nr:Rne/Rng family ribonuclease [Terriglobia bacterium]